MEVAEFYQKYGEEIKELLGMCGEEEDYLYLFRLEEKSPKEDLIVKSEALKKKIIDDGDDIKHLNEILMTIIKSLADYEELVEKEEEVPMIEE